MKFKSFLVFTLLTFGLAQFSNAQSTASVGNGMVPNSSDLPVMEGEDWTFYMDEANQIYYIDFETIKVNLNDIQVKNEIGEVVMKDNVWDLPVNTIYELDCKTLKPGKYEVQLRTYTGIIKKDIQVN